MSVTPDPFSYHPELRDKIADPLQSFFRTFTTESLATISKARGLPIDWWYSESAREVSRARTLAGRRDSDLWCPTSAPDTIFIIFLILSASAYAFALGGSPQRVDGIAAPFTPTLVA